MALAYFQTPVPTPNMSRPATINSDVQKRGYHYTKTFFSPFVSIAFYDTDIIHFAFRIALQSPDSISSFSMLVMKRKCLQQKNINGSLGGWRQLIWYLTFMLAFFLFLCDRFYYLNQLDSLNQLADPVHFLHTFGCNTFPNHS